MKEFPGILLKGAQFRAPQGKCVQTIFYYRGLSCIQMRRNKFLKMSLELDLTACWSCHWLQCGAVSGEAVFYLTAWFWPMGRREGALLCAASCFCSCCLSGWTTGKFPHGIFVFAAQMTTRAKCNKTEKKCVTVFGFSALLLELKLEACRVTPACDWFRVFVCLFVCLLFLLLFNIHVFLLCSAIFSTPAPAHVQAKLHHQSFSQSCSNIKRTCVCDRHVMLYDSKDFCMRLTELFIFLLCTFSNYDK